MADPSAQSSDDNLDDRLLSAMWARLDEAQRLSTGASAIAQLVRIATLADEVAALARVLELIQPTEELT